MNEKQEIHIGCDGVQYKVEHRRNNGNSDVDNDEEFEHLETPP